MKDIWLNESGNFVVDATGDLRVAENMDMDLQTVSFRIKTENGELILHPEIGTSLAALIGQPLTPENLRLGEFLIRESLTFDGTINDSLLSVKGVPLSSTSCLFIIEIVGEDLKREFALTIPFDMLYGINLDDINAVGSTSIHGS